MVCFFDLFLMRYYFVFLCLFEWFCGIVCNWTHFNSCWPENKIHIYWTRLSVPTSIQRSVLLAAICVRSHDDLSWGVWARRGMEQPQRADCMVAIRLVAASFVMCVSVCVTLWRAVEAADSRKTRGRRRWMVRRWSRCRRSRIWPRTAWSLVEGVGQVVETIVRAWWWCWWRKSWVATLEKAKATGLI